MMRRHASIISSVLVLSCAAAAWAQNAPRPGQGGRRGQPQWRPAVQLYTFNRVDFFTALDKAKEAGVRAVEGFSWHKISKDTGEAQLSPAAPAEAIEKAQKKLQEAQMRLVGYYVGDFGKDEAEARKYFEFGKKMGIEFFVSEPKAELLPVLDKLAQEFEISLAYHNHPKDPQKPEYTNWDPEQVMKMIKPLSKRIGICADTGHMIRSGMDPVEGLKKYEGRIISLHLKDVNEKGEKGHDVPLGTGIGNVKGQLEELKRQNFRGVIAIEYEHNMEDNLADVQKSVEFLRTTARELGVMGGRGQGQGPGGGRGQRGAGRNRPGDASVQ